MLFKDIVGHNAIKKRLVQTVNENRVSHAQLFLGPDGSGGLPLALAYAQYLTCTNRQKPNNNDELADSCGSCPSCLKYNKLAHPDLHLVFPIINLSSKKTIKEEDGFRKTEISDDLILEFREAFFNNPYLNLLQWYSHLDAENKQGLITVRESAEILRKISLTTFESEYKIVIIWRAEKMHLSAANKMLKILEEPPDKTLFILVTENEELLLRTIVSRTQIIKLNKISDQDLFRNLVENRDLPEQEANRVVQLADGNYNSVVQLLNVSEELQFNFVSFQKWMRSCLKFDAIKVLPWVDEMAGIGRERQKNFFSYALRILRESFLISNDCENLVKLDKEELDFVKKFSPFIHASNIEEFMVNINSASQHIERNANPKILLLDLSFKVNELLNIPVSNIKTENR